MKDLELCTYIATRESVGATARYVNLPLRNNTPVTSGSNRSKLLVTAFDVPSILLARYCSRGLYFDTAPTLRADHQPRQNGLVLEDHSCSYRIKAIRPGGVLVGLRPFEVRSG